MRFSGRKRLLREKQARQLLPANLKGPSVS
jgi:hypothetical protein